MMNHGSHLEDIFVGSYEGEQRLDHLTKTVAAVQQKISQKYYVKFHKNQETILTYGVTIIRQNKKRQ